MELRAIEAFVAVVQHKGFTRAAEALHLSQPAVTRQIAALEAELKTPLFDRLGRTVPLTTAGEAFYHYAEEILRLAREAQQAVAEIGAGVAGRLAVGASSTLATYVLPPLLRQFREAYPRVDLAVHTGISAQVLEMVRANVVEVGLVTSEVEEGLLSATALADYGTCVVVPPSHPLATRAAVHTSELAGSPLILMETGTNLRAYTDRLLNAAGVEEQVALELDNVEAIKRMIEAELGISLLPEVAVRAEVATGRLAALQLTDVPATHRRITCVYRRDKHRSHALQAFLHLLQAALASEPLPRQLP